MDKFFVQPGPAPSGEELSAYADGELGDRRAAEVAAYVESDEEIARRLASYRRLQANLREEFALESWHFRPLILDRRQHASGRLRPALVNMAACIVGLVLGGVAMVFSNNLDSVASGKLADQALVAFQTESVRPQLVSATGHPDANATSFAAEFLAAPLQVPLVLAGGFTLVAWQPESGEDAALLRLRYEDASGKPLIVLVSSASIGTPSEKFEWRSAGEHRICFWRGRNLRFAMVGKLSRDSMVDIAKALQQREVL